MLFRSLEGGGNLSGADGAAESPDLHKLDGVVVGDVYKRQLLPTTFPNVLVSANQGIAVGMASNLCGFNLGEVCDATVAFLKNPQVNLLDHLKAPDFPTGGELLYDEGALRQIYETGRGSFQVRAKWRYLKGENLIEIYEIPYTTTEIGRAHV